MNNAKLCTYCGRLYVHPCKGSEVAAECPNYQYLTRRSKQLASKSSPDKRPKKRQRVRVSD